eukprot:SAG31_NODE_356_length_17180_cov_7.595925_4_plen_220_part_00
MRGSMAAAPQEPPAREDEPALDEEDELWKDIDRTSPRRFEQSSPLEKRLKHKKTRRRKQAAATTLTKWQQRQVREQAFALGARRTATAGLFAFREGQESADCPICFNALGSHRKAASLSCGHVFCISCIHKDMAMPTAPKSGNCCPMCRRPYRAKHIIEVDVELLVVGTPCDAASEQLSAQGAEVGPPRHTDEHCRQQTRSDVCPAPRRSFSFCSGRPE